MLRTALFATVILSGAAAASERGEIPRGEGDSALWTFSAGAVTSSTEIQETFRFEEDIAYYPIAVGFSMGGFSAGVETGWLEAQRSGTVLAGQTIYLPIGGRLVPLTPRRDRTFTGSASGMADTVVSARYDFAPWRDTLTFALTADAKLPTADEAEFLGSGETDVAVGAEIGAIGALSPYLGVGFQQLGEPEGVTYDSVAFGYVGVDAIATDALSFSVVYDYGQTPVSGQEDYQAVGAAARWYVTPNVRLSLTGQAGLSETAADTMFGLSIGLSR